jgi:hypothetical protein
MERKELWTATAFLLVGGGMTVTGWQGMWIAAGFWGVAVLILGFVWRDDIWEFSESVRRKPRWKIGGGATAQLTDDRLALGLYVSNPQRDGEFYGRVEEVRGLANTPRPPWDLRWRSQKARHTIGFKDRDLVDVAFIKRAAAGWDMWIPHAEPPERHDEEARVDVDGDLTDVAFLIVMRRANRRACVERWVGIAIGDKGYPVLVVLPEGEEPD